MAYLNSVCGLRKGLFIPFLFLFILASSCKEKPLPDADFRFFLDERCMIVNTEQDNTIEGEYLKVVSGGNTKTITINIPPQFYITQKNYKNWVVGWGNGKSLYDAGSENLRTIDSINLTSNTIILGKTLRGDSCPADDQRIVFWNINPSSFIKEKKQPIIDPSQWRGFKGESVGFGSVVFDSTEGKWTMFINEVDTDKIQIYAAVSDDLINWSAANNGNPVLTADDFKNISWAGKNKKEEFLQTAVVSDIIHYNNKWYFFMDGYDKNGKQNIGIAVAENSILGPYKTFPDPAISPGNKGNWKDKGCFYAKVIKYKDHFIMFFDGVNGASEERVGMATSKDLIHWKEYEDNPVLSQHEGWRSSKTSSEPVYVEARNDTIFLMVSGAKKFKMGFWHHYISHRMYMDKSGNVNDTELGAFFSTDEGKTFIPHQNNPIFINDYSDEDENDHLGGNFELVKTDTADFIFYQAKTDKPVLKYNIFYRIKRK